MEDIALDTSKHEIRLVHLQPGIYSSPIQCKLARADLDQRHRYEYEPLSYEWGPSGYDQFIWLGDRKVYVRENLYWALRHLRYERAVRVLWIDALCIDQTNVVERNHQVTWMGEIYKRAVRVVIWLGRALLSPKDYTIIFDSIEAFQLLFLPKKSKILTLAGKEDAAFRAATEFFPIHLTRAGKIVYNLFNLTYWKRLWILQEVLSATRILIQHGYQYYSWDFLDRIVLQCQHSRFRQYIKRNRHLRHHLKNIDMILDTVPSRLCQERRNLKKSRYKALPLLDLVLRYHDAECQNLQDKVFGLRSLSQFCCKKEVAVDYSKSTLQICQELLRHHSLYHSSADKGAFCLIQKTRSLCSILKAEFHSDASEILVYASKNVISSSNLIHLTCYLRGPILYVDRPAQTTADLRSHWNPSAIPMPPTLNQALRTSMRSFLKDAKDYLPTTCKPDYTGRSWATHLRVICTKRYNSLVASVKQESIWHDWLWGLELPDHEDLWAEWPFIFFTADGQIGLAAEEYQIGDIACEFDRKKADSIILRKVGSQFRVVGSSCKVLGAWGPTPRGSLQRITISLDVAALQSVSERFDLALEY
jgi:Heterokaryon incompatibility protein (HET)